MEAHLQPRTPAPAASAASGISSAAAVGTANGAPPVGLGTGTGLGTGPGLELLSRECECPHYAREIGKRPVHAIAMERLCKHQLAMLLSLLGERCPEQPGAAAAAAAAGASSGAQDGASPRGADWWCPRCEALVVGHRQECYRCRMPQLAVAHAGSSRAADAAPHAAPHAAPPAARLPSMPPSRPSERLPAASLPPVAPTPAAPLVSSRSSAAVAPGTAPQAAAAAATAAGAGGTSSADGHAVKPAPVARKPRQLPNFSTASSPAARPATVAAAVSRPAAAVEAAAAAAAAAATVAGAEAAVDADRRSRPSSMTELIKERLLMEELIKERPLMEELIKERPLRVSTLDRLARATLERAGRPYTSPAAAEDADERPCAAPAATPAVRAAPPAVCAAPAETSALAATDVPAALATRVVPGAPIAPVAATTLGGGFGAVVDSPLPAPPVGTLPAAVPSPCAVRKQRRIHMLMDDIFGD